MILPLPDRWKRRRVSRFDKRFDGQKMNDASGPVLVLLLTIGVSRACLPGAAAIDARVRAAMELPVQFAVSVSQSCLTRESTWCAATP
jgi:hypothetical protein